MKAHILIAAAAVTLGLAAPAIAAAADNSTANCFLSRDWQDWRGADKQTIYLRIHSHDVWKVGLSAGGSNMVVDPTNHLIHDVHGGNSWICKPIDLDLKISDGHIVEPLFVTSLEKLTPEQVAAIPKKDLP